MTERTAEQGACVASVTLTDITKYFDTNQVLHDINLTVKSGEFIVLVGPSGCGKSTLLRIIAGLEAASSGIVSIDEADVSDIPPSKRDIAMVFQNYALYPHMSARENLAFSLDIHHVPQEEIDSRIEEAAEFLQLSDYLDRSPKALSGGQRQRVAIGRAIVRRAGVFLFDEPLSNLDAALRLEMRLKIAELNRHLPDASMIYVTHDQIEAMTLADRIVVLSDNGGIEQVGLPEELYLAPSNLFVATFIGSPAMNILPVKVMATGNVTRVRTRQHVVLDVPILTDAFWQDQDLLLGIRPEHLSTSNMGCGGLSGQITHIEKLGAYSLVHTDPGLDEPWLIAKADGTTHLSKGDSVTLTASPTDFHLFEPGGKNLRSVAIVPQTGFRQEHQQEHQ